MPFQRKLAALGALLTLTQLLGVHAKKVVRHVVPTFAEKAPWALAGVDLSDSTESDTAVTLEVDDENGQLVQPGPRRLQTTCSPSNPSNGVYSGSPPSLTSCIYGGNYLYASTTWTLKCNTGYYLVGSSSGTCTGRKYCYYSSTVYDCYSTCWYSGPCYWCCICSNSYSFSAASGYCAQCVPPAASNAVNPSTQNGQVTYSWTCAAGYYGSPVSRSCTSSGSWTGSAISCAACSAPSAPTNGYVSKLSSNTWRYSCNAGYYSPSVTVPQDRVCDSTSGGFSGSAPTCSACGGNGYYCTGVDRLQCPPGTFGLAGATTLSSSSCSGSCTAGYFCPLGSTSSTAFACGSVDKYCPTGSGAPVAVSAGYYTTPTSGSPSLRTGQAVCPANRACAGGEILPAITFPAECSDGTAAASVPESFSGVVFGPTFAPSTPGYAGTLSWSVLSVSGAESTCGLQASNFTFLTTSTTGRLKLGTWPLDYPSCSNGFTVNLRVARSNDNTLFATCAVAVTVTQVAKQPIITDCAPRSVAERTVAGTVVGAPLSAINRNIGTSLLWFINTTGLPFSVGLCDGQVRVLRPLYWASASTYTLPIVVRNDGSSLGIGSSEAGCTLKVNVTMVALPPVPQTTTFYLPELSPVGTRVGNVNAVDPANFTITNHTWAAVDTPNAFAIDRWGNITVTAVVDTLKTLKSTFYYRVNVSNAFAMSSTPITIILMPVPRPPQTFDQTRTILENAVAGTTLPPALIATHPQNLNVTFAVTPSSTFGVTPAGTVFLQTGASLDYNIQSTYTLSIIATDTNGQTATASLTINLIEVNKQPQFCCSSRFDFTVDEYSIAGNDTVGAQPVYASDPNTRDSITYRVVAASPSRGSALFALDPVTGSITVGLGVISTGGVLLFDPTLTYPEPQTFILNVTATDNGIPRLSANATVRIRVTNIRPRINFTPSNSGSYSIPGNASIGLVVADLANVSWTPYARDQLRFSISTELNANGDVPFVVDPLTGLLTVANTTYSDRNHTFGPPRWDYNTKSAFVVNVTVTDSVTQQFSLSSIRVMLGHINRAPSWRPVPMLFAAALTSGNVGAPLMTYVDDPDVALNVGEMFNFTLLAGNANQTFAVDAATGQIYVANNNTQAFQSRGGVGVFNLTIMVKDAGIDGPRYNATTFVGINITDSNRPPTVGYANFSVDELVPTGTIVGTFSGSDIDSWQTLNYTISPAGPNINRPFPFAIRTLNGGQNTGQIYVIDDGPIDWNNMFKVYYATITATDSHPTMPLSASAQITIYVRWVPKPPYFSPSKVPASATFTFSIPQHSPPGTVVSSQPVTALSKDPWRIPNLRYAWVNPGTLQNLFTINDVTGQVTVAAGAPDISIYTATQYTLTARVTDDNVPALTDTATVRINIQETNDPAVWTGLFTPSWTSASEVAVSEAAPVGTLIGFINATDPNWTPMWKARNFGLVTSDADARFFAVNSTTGAITVGQPGLDFWDQTRFRINVTCTDNDPFNAITVYMSVSITLIQVNTVRVLGFVVPPTLSAQFAVNVSGSSYASNAAYTNTDVLFRTIGLTQPEGIWIVGSGFGRTWRRLQAEGASVEDTNVTAVFGPALRYTATCKVYVANTVIRCAVPPGAGSGHTWRVYVDGWLVTPSMRTGYLPPSVTGVTKDDAAQTLSTRGGEAVFVDGTNFGPLDHTDLQLSYGPASGPLTYVSPSCVMTAAHARLRCITQPGIGANLGWLVTVSAQSSLVFSGSTVRYNNPSISSVRAGLLATDGYQQNAIQVNGSDFGPTGTTGIVVQYGVDFTDAQYPVWTALNCEVSSLNPHATVYCTSAPGIGRDLRVRITVGGQTSVVSSDSLSYMAPTIQNIAGLGADNADTIGGQQIIISGFNFGPLTPLDGGGFPIPGLLQPIARYGRYNAASAALGVPLKYMAAACRVSVAHRQIICETIEGTGSQLVWQIFVGNQTSGPFFNRTTSYHPPIVASYSGNGSVNAETYGGQVVVIEGKNFGPGGTIIDRATYGNDVNGSTFDAENCFLSRPHTTVVCYTTVGAGAGLAWYLTIDGQRSVAPSTAYGAPTIESFTGTFQDASTDGGDVVTLHGRFFSVDRWLNRVTYGPSGTEYTAADCRLAVNHTAITCSMRAGTGRALRWLVTVGGQTSALSPSTTSYAPPAITSVLPGNGTTEGGMDVNVTGTNFAFLYAAAQVTVKINNLNGDRPSQSELDAHWAALYAGTGGVPSVGTWIDGLTTLRPTATRVHGRDSVHSLRVIIPEGFGPAAEVFVLVNGIPSNVVTFRYNAPIISNIAPDRQNVSLGYLRVFVEGSSFCSGSGGCGTVLVNNASVAVRSWGHREIMFVMPDPSTADAPSFAQVFVAGVGSNTFNFKKPVPNINNLVTQANWIHMDTRGGEVFYIVGVMDIGLEPVSIYIGGRECTNVTRQVDNNMQPTDYGASFTLRCTTPPGVGLSNSIIIVSVGGASRNDGSFTLSYAAPSLTDMSLLTPVSSGTRRLAIVNGIPTLGANVSIVGTNLGAASIAAGFASMDNAMELQVLSQSDTEVVVAIPPGDGTGHFITYTVGSQTSPPIFFRYTAPTVTGIAASHGPTVGGTLVAVTGSNFGVTLPTITINGRNCTVAEPFSPSAGHDLVQCRTPYGQGRDWPVLFTVSGQSSSASTPVAFSYDPPVVYSVWPRSGPTSGRLLGDLQADGLHRDQGARINMTLIGDNLGRSGSIELRIHELSDPLAVSVPVPAGDILSWNDTVVLFMMPAGYGDSLHVVAMVSGQESGEVVEFKYDPPSVVAIARADRTTSECQPRPLCFTYILTEDGQNSTEQCKMIPAGCYSTAGGYPLEIIGESFGRLSARVTVGGRDCPLVGLQDHNRVVCTVPKGLGDANDVVVSVGSRSSPTHNMTRFAYDPPLVQSTMPNTPNALGDDVVFQGKNFGFERTDVSITISNKVCVNAEWLNDARLKCRTEEDVVGPKNVSVLVANRTSPYIFYEFENMFLSECQAGYYGLDGEFCKECPQGAKCPGREHAIDRTYSLPGFWKQVLQTSAAAPAALCHPEAASKRLACPYFAACEPTWSCTGNNTCAEGYTDVRCSQCVRGKYYRVNGECIKCPDSPWAVIVAMALALCAMVGIAYMLNKKNVSIALISIGVDYFQIMSMFARTRIRWPPLVKQVFQIMSAFNLNLELTAPECMIPTLAFWQKWFFIEALPLVAVALFVIVHAVKTTYKACCLNKKKEQLMSHLPTLVSTCVVIFRVLYLYLTRTSLDVMNCSPTDPPDGHVYMNGMLDVECWQPGSQQVFLFPFALITLGVYSAALPLAVLLFMRRHRDAIKYDQILRAKGLGDDRLTNPKYYAFRKMWSKLYYHYKPGKWYWEMVITARKGAIAVTSLMFRNTPSYQLSVALLVMFAAFVLHMRHLPYLTHADKPQVLEEHMSKVTTDPLHATIEADMRAVEKKNTRKRTRVATFAIEPKKTSLVGMSVLYVFDYNTVEAVLLGCCILINLAGIMFDSSRFKGSLGSVYAQEYDVLAVFAMVLISLSVVYYVVVIALDLTVLCCPQQAGPCIASLSCKRAMPARKGATKVAAGSMGIPKMLELGSDGADDGPAMHVNPFMLRQHAANAGAVDGDLPLGAQGILDPTQMESIATPNPAMWRAVKDSYGRMHVMIEELSKQLREAKQSAEMLATSSSHAGGARPLALQTAARRKNEFSPLAASFHDTKRAEAGETADAFEVGGGADASSGAPSAFTSPLASVKQLRTTPRVATFAKPLGASSARLLGAKAAVRGSKRALLGADDATIPDDHPALASIPTSGASEPTPQRDD